MSHNRKQAKVCLCVLLYKPLTELLFRCQMEGSDAEGFDSTPWRRFVCPIAIDSHTNIFLKMKTDWSEPDEDVGGLFVDDKHSARQKGFIQDEINKAEHRFYYLTKGSPYADFDAQGTIPTCANPVCGGA